MIFPSIVSIYLYLAKLTNAIDQDVLFDVFRNSSQLIESRGFKSSEYSVVTDDGYVLKVFRIINPSVNTPRKPPILLWHGILQSSDSWLVSQSGGLLRNGVYQEYQSRLLGRITDCETRFTSNLAFTLAACGYDVWLGNTRGNPYADKHVKLSKLSPQFWTFSITELAIYDVPAVTKLVTDQTQSSELAYVGFSLATTQMFALLSLRPTMAQVIRPFLSFSSCVYYGQSYTPLELFISAFEPLFRYANGPFGVPKGLGQAIGALAANIGVINNLVADVLQFVVNPDPAQLNLKRVPTYIGRALENSAIRTFVHLGQIIQTGEFKMYDYGPIENLKVYGLTQPNSYHIQNITSKDIYIFSAMNDLQTNTGIETLLNVLKDRVRDHIAIGWAKWNHLDYQLALQSNYYIVKHVFDIMQSYQ